jgi:hypothetical protein
MKGTERAGTGLMEEFSMTSGTGWRRENIKEGKAQKGEKAMRGRGEEYGG